MMMIQTFSLLAAGVGGESILSPAAPRVLTDAGALRRLKTWTTKAEYLKEMKDANKLAKKLIRKAFKKGQTETKTNLQNKIAVFLEDLEKLENPGATTAAPTPTTAAPTPTTAAPTTTTAAPGDSITLFRKGDVDDCLSDIKALLGSQLTQQGLKISTNQLEKWKELQSTDTAGPTCRNLANYVVQTATPERKLECGNFCWGKHRTPNNGVQILCYTDGFSGIWTLQDDERRDLLTKDSCTCKGNYAQFNNPTLDGICAAQTGYDACIRDFCNDFDNLGPRKQEARDNISSIEIPLSPTTENCKTPVDGECTLEGCSSWWGCDPAHAQGCALQCVQAL